MAAISGDCIKGGHVGGGVLFKVPVKQGITIQQIQLESQINVFKGLKALKQFVILKDRILQSWKVITATTILSFVTVGLNAASYTNYYITELLNVLFCYNHYI